MPRPTARTARPPRIPSLDGGPVYDSAYPEVGVLASLRRVATNTRLVSLLVHKELTSRYRRSALGVIWALVTPVLTVLVMWLVFENVLPVADLGVPYAVYLASGILALTAAQQGIIALGSSLQNYESLLSRIHLPAEILAAGSMGAIAVHLSLATVAVLALQVLLGVGVPLTALLAPAVLLTLLAFTSGIGMLVAGIALRLPDVLHLVGIAIYLLGFLTPTFFPISALDDPGRWIVEANPLTGYLELLRGCLYEGEVGSAARWIVSVTLGVSMLVAGTASFARAGRRAVVAG
ncbi:MAG TPA: ABC transporter permease [Acidimicrobiales bacterium]